MTCTKGKETLDSEPEEAQPSSGKRVWKFPQRLEWEPRPLPARPAAPRPGAVGTAASPEEPRGRPLAAGGPVGSQSGWEEIAGEQ